LAKSYARIHWQNLVNFGVLPLEYDSEQSGPIEVGDRLVVHDVARALRAGRDLDVHNTTKGTTIQCQHRLSPRQVDMLLAGGRIAEYRGRSS
jgi:aconitate hydratase